MPVELITTQGSHAGTAAKIHPGYYLVGRHKECQIRPKSKSVSRRHCLLLHNEDGFGALDLKSTSGTWVNGVRLHPHEWRVLHHGDEIRFGKVCFDVSISNMSLAAVATAADSVDSHASPDSGIAPAPQSWQSQEIAEFLELEDQVEFEKRYGLGDDDLRATVNTAVHDGDSAMDGEVDVLTDDETGSRKTGDTIVGDLDDDEFGDSGLEDDGSDRMVEVDPKPKKKPPKRQIDHSQYKKRSSSRSVKLPSFSFGADGMNWKALGAIALITVSVSALGYQIYSFSAGPNLEIRQGLD